MTSGLIGRCANVAKPIHNLKRLAIFKSLREVWKNGESDKKIERAETA